MSAQFFRQILGSKQWLQTFLTNMVTVVEFVRVAAKIRKFMHYCIHIRQFQPLKWRRNLIEPILNFEIFNWVRLAAILLTVRFCSFRQ